MSDTLGTRHYLRKLTGLCHYDNRIDGSSPRARTPRELAEAESGRGEWRQRQWRRGGEDAEFGSGTVATTAAARNLFFVCLIMIHSCAGARKVWVWPDKQKDGISLQAASADGSHFTRENRVDAGCLPKAKNEPGTIGTSTTRYFQHK
jgi:hypothetical protein